MANQSDERARSVRLLARASKYDLQAAEAQSDSGASRGQRLALQHRDNRQLALSAGEARRLILCGIGKHRLSCRADPGLAAAETVLKALRVCRRSRPCPTPSTAR